MLHNKELPKSFAIFVRSSYGDLLVVDPLIKYIKQLNTDNKITLFVEDKLNVNNIPTSKISDALIDKLKNIISNES
tara:strand:+ start:192 stop:419 length:228 start_codon:yes stop_codon:yes gene_type:complete